MNFSQNIQKMYMKFFCLNDDFLNHKVHKKEPLSVDTSVQTH